MKSSTPSTSTGIVLNQSQTVYEGKKKKKQDKEKAPIPGGLVKMAVPEH